MSVADVKAAAGRAAKRWSSTCATRARSSARAAIRGRSPVHAATCSNSGRPDSPYAKPIFQENKKFIFHCASGWRSALAARTAQDMGLKPVAHLGGGFTAWRDAGEAVEKVEPRKR